MSTARVQRRRRVLIVRPSLAEGGADRVTVTLLQSLSRDRFELSLALNRAEGPFLEDVPADVRVHELGARDLWTAWVPLRQLLRESRPDVLFSTCGGMNLPACVATLFEPTGHRLVLSERNVLIRDHPPARRWSLLLAKALLYERADCITTVSRGVKDDLVSRLSLDPESIRVVYNPAATSDIGELARAEPPHPWLSEVEPVVLGAGRLVPAKGFDLLIRAIARVRRRRPVRLIVLGEGPERPRLEALARGLGIGEDVSLPGFDKNPFAYMDRCALFVLSSRWEGLPGVLIQAMACGAAVVAADCPAGPSEIVSPGRDGSLVPAEDVGALAAAIGGLLDDPEERRRLGEKARASAQRFGRQPVVDLYERALL